VALRPTSPSTEMFSIRVIGCSLACCLSVVIWPSYLTFLSFARSVRNPPISTTGSKQSFTSTLPKIDRLVRASSQRQSSEINLCMKWKPESFLFASQYLNVLTNLRALNGPRRYSQRQSNTWLWHREHAKDTRAKLKVCLEMSRTSIRY